MSRRIDEGSDRMSLKEQYEQLAELERDTTKTRYTTFTAILSISFILPGLALRPEAEGKVVHLPGFHDVTLSQVVFLLGFLFYLFALFHYAWHHRYSHHYRSALKNLEAKLGIKIYRLRVRPQIWRFKFHFDWALHMLALVYGGLTAAYVGIDFLAAALGIIIGAYAARSLLSALEPSEPLEE